MINIVHQTVILPKKKFQRLECFKRPQCVLNYFIHILILHVKSPIIIDWYEKDYSYSNKGTQGINHILCKRGMIVQ